MFECCVITLCQEVLCYTACPFLFAHVHIVSHARFKAAPHMPLCTHVCMPVPSMLTGGVTNFGSDAADQMLKTLGVMMMLLMVVVMEAGRQGQ